MQLNLSKVSSRSIITPTPKIGGWSRKGLYFDCVGAKIGFLHQQYRGLSEGVQELES